MIDHVSVAVRDLDRAGAFYERLLTPLGYAKLVMRPGTIGFGKKYPEFWLNERAAMTPADADTGTHICFRAASTAAVDAFHAAALDAGAQDCGAPGLRPHYGATYYAAFVIDLDGYKIEAVHQ